MKSLFRFITFFFFFFLSVKCCGNRCGDRSALFSIFKRVSKLTQKKRAFENSHRRNIALARIRYDVVLFSRRRRRSENIWERIGIRATFGIPWRIPLAGLIERSARWIKSSSLFPGNTYRLLIGPGNHFVLPNLSLSTSNPGANAHLN